MRRERRCFLSILRFVAVKIIVLAKFLKQMIDYFQLCVVLFLYKLRKILRCPVGQPRELAHRFHLTLLGSRIRSADKVIGVNIQHIGNSCEYLNIGHSLVVLVITECVLDMPTISANCSIVYPFSLRNSLNLFPNTCSQVFFACSSIVNLLISLSKSRLAEICPMLDIAIVTISSDCEAAITKSS